MLKIRRTITIEIEGPHDEVNAAAQAVMLSPAIMRETDTVRWRVTGQMDPLNDRGEVVTREVAELARQVRRDG